MDIDKFLKESKESVKDDESKPWRSAALKPKPPAAPKPAAPKPVRLPPITASQAWGKESKQTAGVEAGDTAAALSRRNARVANKTRYLRKD